MNFKCHKCGKVFKRDARSKATKVFLYKRGYKSYCEKEGVIVYCKELKQ